jgi:hypothetical protein
MKKNGIKKSCVSFFDLSYSLPANVIIPDGGKMKKIQTTLMIVALPKKGSRLNFHTHIKLTIEWLMLRKYILNIRFRIVRVTK